MSTPKPKSLKDTFKQAAAAMASTVGIAATMGMGAGAMTAAPVIAAGAAAGSIMGIAGLSFGKKFDLPSASDADDGPLLPAPEIKISVETGAPVKAMKPIRLRR